MFPAFLSPGRTIASPLGYLQCWETGSSARFPCVNPASRPGPGAWALSKQLLNEKMNKHVVIILFLL